MLYNDSHDYWEDKRKREAQKNSPEQRKLDAEADESANAKLDFFRRMIEIGAYPEFKASLRHLPSLPPTATYAQRDAQYLECFNFWQAYCFIVKLPIAESVL